ncbi:ras-related protein Rab-7L1-like isoform X2 [Periplaneta americana]|uniref:ras-related protein Rab-7L1-like isoform X2 n=1 Tax=Periplaneta americana TaxID=6978 RepID=UPI0037E830A4
MFHVTAHYTSRASCLTYTCFHVCFGMSERTHLVFWPSVGETRQNSLHWEETHRLQKEETLDEDSGPESDVQVYPVNPVMETRSIVIPEKLYKVIVIGDPTVGKTSFVQRYVQNSFRKDYKGTVGVDFALKIVKWSDKQTVKLQLWDIAGQERFTWMTRVYYKDCHGCVLMFDLTNKNSFVNTHKWKRDVDAKCTLPDGNPIPCILLANKCDLPQRQVDQMEIESFYKENSFIGWTETSAKEGLMVNDSMKFLVDAMMRQDGIHDVRMSESLRLSGPASSAEHRKRCSC